MHGFTIYAFLLELSCNHRQMSEHDICSKLNEQHKSRSESSNSMKLIRNQEGESTSHQPPSPPRTNSLLEVLRRFPCEVNQGQLASRPTALEYRAPFVVVLASKSPDTASDQTSVRRVIRRFVSSRVKAP
jgi:hypothetical protein